MEAAAGQIDNRAQPLHWRVLIALPPVGLGAQAAIMRAWLDHHCGRSGWAAAPAGTGGVVNDAVAFYFTDRAAAGAFVERFSCGYRAGCRTDG